MNEWSAKPKQRMTAAKWLLLAVFANLAKTSKTEISALSAPYRACTALPDKDIIHAVTRENRGLWSVCIGILKGRERIVIQFTDFKSGNYHRGLSSNFRVGSNQIPLCSSQKRKAAYIPPGNRGYVCPGSNLLPENSRYWPGGSVFW